MISAAQIYPEAVSGDGEIVLVHDGTSYEVKEAGILTFGRASSCDIHLDAADLGISRLAGSVEHEAGTWWIFNRSGRRPLVAVDDIGIRQVIPPGRRFAVVSSMTVIVEGSLSRHAISIRVVPAAPVETEPDGPDSGIDEVPPTLTAAVVVVNDLDRLALVALFSGYLEEFPRYDPHPKSYADAAAALGWPRSTLLKRIEYLRTRLSNFGVPNLVGDTGLSYLAEWVLTTGVLARSDLELLRQHRGDAPNNPT